jgi:hypothetical protein
MTVRKKEWRRGEGERAGYVGGDDGDDLVVAQFDGREDAAEDPGQLGLVLLRRGLRAPGHRSGFIRLIILTVGWREMRRTLACRSFMRPATCFTMVSTLLILIHNYIRIYTFTS